MVSVPAATPTAGDAAPADWQVALEAQIALAGTPLPTPDMGMAAFVPPTLPPTADPKVPLLIQPCDCQVSPWPTPTFRPPSAADTLWPDALPQPDRGIRAGQQRGT